MLNKYEILTLCSPYEDSGSKNRKKLYLPCIEDKNSNMKMLHVSSYDALLPNSMNILEPTPQDHDGNEREERMLILVLFAHLFNILLITFDKFPSASN